MEASGKFSLGRRNVKRMACASIRATAGVRSAFGAGDGQGFGSTGTAQLGGAVFEGQFLFRALLAVRCTRVAFAKLAVRVSSLRRAASRSGVHRRLTTQSSGRRPVASEQAQTFSAGAAYFER